MFGTAKIQQKTLRASFFLTFFSKKIQEFDYQGNNFSEKIKISNQLVLSDGKATSYILIGVGCGIHGSKGSKDQKGEGPKTGKRKTGWIKMEGCRKKGEGF